MAIIDFRKEFERALKEEEMTYEPKGIITQSGKIYPLGTDTKVLSSVFEMLVKPTIYRVARENNLIVREAHAQNYYPDFTLMSDESDPQKIAVDIKTTYRRRQNQTVKFTLGSYTSFIRQDNETKNIEFPDREYTQYWIVGFIYTRKVLQEGAANVYQLSELRQIPTPFSEVEMFVAEKWKIAGGKAGSDNTGNIGSITRPHNHGQRPVPQS
jgi:hypothetical protein